MERRSDFVDIHVRDDTMFQFFLTSLAGIARAVASMRRRLGIATEQEARHAYLDEAGDRIDLELRIRHLDRVQGSFNSFADRSWHLSA